MMLKSCIISLFLFFSITSTAGNNHTDAKTDSTVMLKKVMEDIYTLSESMQQKLWYYESDFIFRGTLHKTQHNIAYLALPHRSFFRHGGRTITTEEHGKQSYSEIVSFYRKVFYIDGTPDNMSMADDYVTQLFYLTPYEDYAIPGVVLSPLSRPNRRSYRYKIEHVSSDSIVISYKARHKICVLADGQFTYNTRRNYITHITINGVHEYTKYRLDVTMGNRAKHRYWPSLTKLDFEYWYLWNTFVGNATMRQTYTTLSNDGRRYKRKNNRYDVTEFLALQRDTTHLRFAEKRDTIDIPKDTVATDTIASPHGGGPSPLKALLRGVAFLGEGLFHSHTIRTSTNSTLRIHSPELSYSGWRGVTAQVKGRYHLDRPSGRSFTISPSVGYNFKPLMAVWQLNTDYTYAPLHNAKVIVNASERGMQASAERLSSFSSDTRPDVEVQDYSVLFRDIRVDLLHNIEVINGLDFLCGATYHHRATHHMSPEERSIKQLAGSYRSFAMRLNITYTPRVRYHVNNNRKVLLGSPWPTFCLDFERGIKGTFMDSNNKYERWEFTINNEMRLTPLHRFLWKVGGGMFTNKENVDFVSYEYFNNGITDHSWDDALCGVFHLLDGKYYNASYRYLRAHGIIDTPVLLINNINTYVVHSERLYLSLLYTDRLFPYIEAGYGISTHILNASVFAAYGDGRYQGTGVKFTFHIFE